MRRRKRAPTILVCEANEGGEEAFRLRRDEWVVVRVIERTDVCIDETDRFPRICLSLTSMTSQRFLALPARLSDELHNHTMTLTTLTEHPEA